MRVLLSVLGLLVLTHALSQQLDVDQIEFLQSKAIDLKVNEAYTNGDWKPLILQISDKRIVLLGEFTHGAREVFVTRNDLIKALHTELDFDVILFESGLGELAAIDKYRGTLDSVQMTHGFFGGWQTDEFAALMQFVKTHQLDVAGFDVQRTGRYFGQYLENMAKAYQIDTSAYVALESRFTEVKSIVTNRKAVFDNVKGPTRKLIEDYRKLYQLLEEIPEESRHESWLLTRRTITNRIAYLEYQLNFVHSGDWAVRWEARDRAMADNVEWLLENLYPGRKVLIIGHNFHIARYNDEIEVMGAMLEDKFDEEMYTIGVFAGQGTYLGNYGDEKVMVDADMSSLDIKHIIGELNGRAHFINVPEYNSSAADWLFRDIIVNDTFIDLCGTNTMTLSEHFDGLLLLDKATPPILNW